MSIVSAISGVTSIASGISSLFGRQNASQLSDCIGAAGIYGAQGALAMYPQCAPYAGQMNVPIGTPNPRIPATTQVAPPVMMAPQLPQAMPGGSTYVQPSPQMQVMPNLAYGQTTPAMTVLPKIIRSTPNPRPTSNTNVRPIFNPDHGLTIAVPRMQAIGAAMTDCLAIGARAKESRATPQPAAPEERKNTYRPNMDRLIASMSTRSMVDARKT